MAPTAVTAPAFTVLDLPAGERTLIGLAHVSTDAQDAQLQHDALTEALSLTVLGGARLGGWMSQTWTLTRCVSCPRGWTRPARPGSRCRRP